LSTTGPEKGGGVRKAGSFFTSLPGIMTGVAALLTAVVGLLTFLGGRDGQEGSEDGFWADQARPACIAAAERIEGIDLQFTAQGEPDYSTWYEDYSIAVDSLVDDLKQLPPPANGEAKASEIIDLWLETSQSFRLASFADSVPERNTHADAGFGSLLRGGEIAATLGAVACRDLVDTSAG
jgi:hypothetical protein